MSEQIKLIKELIGYVEEYQETNKPNDIREFSCFLNDRLLQEKTSFKKMDGSPSFKKENYNNYKQYAEVEFSTLLTNLYRFAKHYIKKAFKSSKIKTIDEFGFLASLLKQKSLLKKELINEHLLETSSGSEILKRLIRKGLIVESEYENDKRAKLVSLSPLGIETIMNSFDEMHKVSEIIVGNLSEEEIKQTLQAFNKLSYFHQDIYKEDRNSDLSVIHTKHIPKND